MDTIYWSARRGYRGRGSGKTGGPLTDGIGDISYVPKAVWRGRRK